MDFAIIKTGGKQYKVSAGEKFKFEKLEGEAGASVTFDSVLLSSRGAKVEIGAPFIDGAVVQGKILQQMRDKKKLVFRYHSKVRYRKRKGHRQHLTEVEITKI